MPLGFLGLLEVAGLCQQNSENCTLWGENSTAIQTDFTRIMTGSSAKWDQGGIKDFQH